jgi:hypothetical protein
MYCRLTKTRRKSSLTRQQIEENYQDAISKAKGNFRLLQQADILRDAEIQAAQTASDEVVTIQNDKIQAIKAINDKYLQIEQDLWDKINIIDNQAQAEIQGITESATAKIVKEWETRREAANKYFEQLKKINDSGFGNQDVLNQLSAGGATNLGNKLIQGQAQATLDSQKTNVNNNITEGEQTAVNKELTKNFTDGLKRGLESFSTDFVDTFANLNQQADKSFSQIFTSLTSKFEATISNLFLNVLVKQLSTALSNSISKGSNPLFSSNGNLSGLGLGIAGAGIAGSIISGSTAGTSSLGQGLGGALKGAALGATIGSVVPVIGTAIGAVGGAIVGGISGLIGAGKARKKLQEEQLAQAKQQTDLLKQSLAYTSSIIGRMTSAGSITGVDVGAFGQLTATVSGKDLQFVLDRNANGR